MTKTVAGAVRAILDNDLVIQQNLKKEIINVRALAKHIIKEHSLKASVDSVISAIRRYKPNRPLTDQKITPSMLLKDAEISTKNNMASIRIKKVHNINAYLAKLASLDLEKGETLRIIKADKKLKVITDEKNVKALLNLFSEDVVEVKEGLSEISLVIGAEAEDTKGVMAHLATEILLAGVNICEVVWCIPEVLIYINKEDLIKTHERLLKLSSR